MKRPTPEACCDIDALTRVCSGKYPGLTPDWREEVVGEAIIEILERFRRNPRQGGTVNTIRGFAIMEGMRQVTLLHSHGPRDSETTSVPLFDNYTPQVSDVARNQLLNQRLEDETNEDAYAAINQTAARRGEADLRTRIALNTLRPRTSEGKLLGMTQGYPRAHGI